MRAILEEIEELAPHVKTFWLRPETHFEYIAGQFAELFLPHTSADQRGQHRWFTLSSSPTEPRVGITVRFTDKDGSSFKQQLQRLSVGTSVQFSDPLGDFVLPIDKARPLVFVAGGLGVTPFRSMIHYLQDKGEARAIHLLHMVSNTHDLFYDSLFRQAAIRYLPFVAKSHFNGSDVLHHASSVRDEALFYVSGPEGMVDSLMDSLQQNGIPRQRLVMDAFPGYQDV